MLRERLVLGDLVEARVGVGSVAICLGSLLTSAAVGVLTDGTVAPRPGIRPSAWTWKRTRIVSGALARTAPCVNSAPQSPASGKRRWRRRCRPCPRSPTGTCRRPSSSASFGSLARLYSATLRGEVGAADGRRPAALRVRLLVVNPKRRRFLPQTSCDEMIWGMRPPVLAVASSRRWLGGAGRSRRRPARAAPVDGPGADDAAGRAGIEAASRSEARDETQARGDDGQRRATRIGRSPRVRREPSTPEG